MSGRPSGTRGRRTRYDGRGFDRRQTSNRYANDPPPRFANRQRNGDGRLSGEFRGGSEYYEEPGRPGMGYSPVKSRDGWNSSGRQPGHGGKATYGMFASSEWSVCKQSCKQMDKQNVRKSVVGVVTFQQMGEGVVVFEG